LLGYLGTALVLAALLLGLPVLLSRRGRFDSRLARRLSALAVSGLLIAAAATLPGLSTVLRWAVAQLPGVGLLRDGQKWLMPFVLLAVLCAGAAVQRLSERLPSPQSQPLSGWPVVVAALALPLVLLPDAPATLKVTLTPVRYPADWQRVADRVRGSTAAVLVLPFASYRSFGWAPGRTVIDPAPRWLPAESVVDDRLVVSGTVLAGEDRRALRLARLLDARPAPNALAVSLAEQGIGWVLVEADTPGPPVPDLSALRPVLDGSALRLYQVPEPVRPAAENPARRWWVIVLDLLTAAVLAAAVWLKAGFAARRLLHSPVIARKPRSVLRRKT
jgi:hypothetical protein